MTHGNADTDIGCTAALVVESEEEKRKVVTPRERAYANIIDRQLQISIPWQRTLRGLCELQTVSMAAMSSKWKAKGQWSGPGAQSAWQHMKSTRESMERVRFTIVVTWSSGVHGEKSSFVKSGGKREQSTLKKTCVKKEFLGRTSDAEVDVGVEMFEQCAGGQLNYLAGLGWHLFKTKPLTQNVREMWKKISFNDDSNGFCNVVADLKTWHVITMGQWCASTSSSPGTDVLQIIRGEHGAAQQQASDAEHPNALPPSACWK